MEPWWLANATSILRVALVVAFLGAALWETVRPRQVLALPAGKRWLLHGLLLVLASVVAPLVYSVSSLAVAASVSDSPYGLLNRAAMPFALRAVLAFLLLDLVQDGDHYLRHKIPLLWRFHQVHHADPDLDFSTGLRFHPGEALFTQGTTLLAIAVLAPPLSVVLCFQICNMVQAFFSHANIALPARVEHALQTVQVTPQLHEIHHSRNGRDQRSNLGVMFSFWDRLFRTYRPVPTSREAPIARGLEEVTPAQSMRPWAMLALPF